MDPAVRDRFWAKVDKDDACWVWTASCRKGYGQFTICGRTLGAHRVAYEMEVGPIPDGLQLDHLCRNTRCVRPAHLEPVTVRENLMRGETPARANSEKTHCVNGHALTGDNLYFHPTTGERICRTCHRARSRASMKKIRERRKGCSRR